MGLLDANIPQLIGSQSTFADQSAAYRSTLAQAEGSAVAAQAFHQGESSAAFQQAHARFIEAAAKSNVLLDVAQQNIGEGASTYVAQDSAAASDVTAAVGHVS